MVISEDICVRRYLAILFEISDLSDAQIDGAIRQIDHVVSAHGGEECVLLNGNAFHSMV
jgi:hypothetical protein